MKTRQISMDAVLGAYAKRKDFSLSNRQTAMSVSLGCVLIFILNTFVMYVDSIVYQYYSFIYIFGAMPLRIVICVVKCIAFSAVMPVLIKFDKKITRYYYEFYKSIMC